MVCVEGADSWRMAEGVQKGGVGGGGVAMLKGCSCAGCGQVCLMVIFRCLAIVITCPYYYYNVRERVGGLCSYWNLLLNKLKCFCAPPPLLFAFIL